MVIEIKELSKTYGSVKALDSLNLRLNEGIYGLLGPNGAGKSTFINLLTDNVKRETGQILCDGTDILELGGRFRSQIGYMPQQQSFYDDFTAINFLKYMAGIKGIPAKQSKAEIMELLKKVNLSEAAHRKIGGFSGGMRQRVILAQALLGNPKILILDEPTAGLDPMERINIRNLIQSLASDKIILYATHVVSDIECIADSILIMKKGRLLCQKSPEELIGDVYGKVAEVNTSYDINVLKKHFAVGNMSQRQDGTVIRIVKRKSDENVEFPDNAYIIENGLNLEDVYLHYLEA